MANGGAYLVAFVIGLAILLTWAIVEIVRRGNDDDDDDPRRIPVGDSDLQLALNEARPGSVINIDEGIYYLSLTTAVDGTPDEPITLRGRPGTDPENVILKGEDGKSRVLEILHSYYVIEDFTINGEIDEDDEEYREQLIFVEGAIEPKEIDGVKSSVDGIVIRNMRIRYAGKECIHMRYFVTNSVVTNCDIRHCGVYHFVLGDSGKTGEGVYIGTAADQWNEKNGDEDVDVCQGNFVMNNYIDTQGNEGVEVKEGSERNVIQYNEIYGQMDEDSGGIGIRGSNNIVRYNDVVEAVGSCVRLGGDDEDGVQYGINNEVYGNKLLRCQNSAVKVINSPQIICENEVEEPSDTDDMYLVVRGDEAEGFDAEAECPDDLTEVVVPPTPTPPTDTTTTSTTDDVRVEAETSFTFIGCFADNIQDRVLELTSEDEDRMTVETCVNECYEEDEDFAGLQYGAECWCGSSSTYDRHGDGLCNYECPGDPTALCGGNVAFSLYAIGDEATEDPTDTDETDETDDDETTTDGDTDETETTTDGDTDETEPSTTTTMDDETGSGSVSNSDDVTIDEPIYLGCFADSASSPVLGEGFESSSMTLKACFTHCNDQDDEIAGLKGGSKCRCGSADDYDRYGQGTCNIPCSGREEERCGGNDALDVYRID